MNSICTCKSYGCGEKGGVTLSTRVIKKHSLRDKAAEIEKGQAEADKAIQEELEAITLHLSNTVLSDSIPEYSSPSGGRLWSKAYPHTRTGSLESASCQDTIQSLLSRLNEIEAAVTTLEVSASLNLRGFEALDLCNLPSFPLRHIEAEHLRLQTDLSRVTLKAAAPVVAMKASIQNQLSDIGKRLTSAKAVWLSQRQARKAAETAQPGVAYSTGRIVPSLVLPVSHVEV